MKVIWGWWYNNCSRHILKMYMQFFVQVETDTVKVLTY